jgi:hypothetical protein
VKVGTGHQSKAECEGDLILESEDGKKSISTTCLKVQDSNN